jgi:quercetin dioxygenase-like cupin family protein
VPVIQASQAVVHEMHGTSFTSYARPTSGSKELCGWRVEIPGHTEGVAHRVSREEVLYLLSGTVRVGLDDDYQDATAGDAIVVPAGALFRVDNLADEPMTAWVTTTAGFGAVMADGSWLTPAWTS